MNRFGHFSIQCSIFLACLASYFFKYPCKMLRILKSQAAGANQLTHPGHGTCLKNPQRYLYALIINHCY